MAAQLSYSSGGSITGVRTIREDFDNRITIMSPNDTPSMTLMRTMGTSDETFSWMVDDIPRPTAVRAKREGGLDALSSQDQIRPRLQNSIMHDHEAVEVADQYRYYEEAGIQDPYNYNAVKVALGMAKQAEVNMRWSEYVVGSAGTAPQTAGIIQWGAVSGQGRRVGNNPTVAGRQFETIYGSTWRHLDNGTALTEDIFQSVIGELYSTGAHIPQFVAFCGRAQKLRISQFGVVYNEGSATSQPLQQFNISMQEKLKIVAIDRYETDFGILHIALDRYGDDTINQTVTEPGTARTFNVRANNTIFGFDPMYIVRRVLIPFHHKPLADTHLTTKGVIHVSHGLHVMSPINIFGISNVDGTQASVA